MRLRYGMFLLWLFAIGCGGAAAADEEDDDEDSGDEPHDIVIKTYAGEHSVRDAPLANAPLVAVQDGDGGWSVLTGAGGTYAAVVTHERYAVAVACATATGSSVEVFVESTSDDRTIEARACPPVTATAALDIELLRIVNDDGGRIWVGGERAEAVRGSDSGVALALGSPWGFRDVMALAYAHDDGQEVTTRAYRTTLDVEGDQQLQIDMLTKALPPVPQQLAVSGVELTDAICVESSVNARFADVPWTLNATVYGAADVTRYAALDERIRQPTDITSVTVSAARTDGARSYTRAVRFDHLMPVAEAVILPAELELDPPALSDDKQPQATVTIPTTDIDPGVDFTVELASDDGSRTLTMYVSPGAAAGGDALTVTTPDLSGLVGWTPAMATPSAPLRWTVTRDERNQKQERQPSDGLRVTSRSVSGRLE